MFRPLVEVDNVPTWPFAIAHMPLFAGSDAAKLLNCGSEPGVCDFLVRGQGDELSCPATQVSCDLK
jgi:hypothetical protein